MRGKRAKAMRRANRGPGRLDERQRLLSSAAVILVEPLLAKSRTGEMTISHESHDLATSLVEKAAAISGRFDDAWAQAQLMAEDAAPGIIAQLPTDFPMDRLSLRDEQTWPVEFLNTPLHRFPQPAAPQAEAVANGMSRVWMRAVHQIAHAMSAVWMTSEPVSVGFSAYSTPKTIGDEALGVVAAAGYASEDDFGFDDEADIGNVCECRNMGMLAAVSQLGIAPSYVQDETMRQCLERIGRWEEVHAVWHTNYDVSRLLVARGRHHGYFDRFVAALIDAGRVEIAPSDLPLLREEDNFVDAVATGRRERAFGAAAGWAAEAETCTAPILVAPGYWGCEWYSEGHEAAARVGGFAAFLAVKALSEPEVLSPESTMKLPPDSSDERVDAAIQALDIVKRRWERIESIAEAVLARGWAVVVDGRPVAPEVSSQNTSISLPMVQILSSRVVDNAQTEPTGRGLNTH